MRTIGSNSLTIPGGNLDTGSEQYYVDTTYVSSGTHNAAVGQTIILTGSGTKTITLPSEIGFVNVILKEGTASFSSSLPIRNLPSMSAGTAVRWFCDGNEWYMH